MKFISRCNLTNKLYAKNTIDGRLWKKTERTIRKDSHGKQEAKLTTTL